MKPIAITNVIAIGFGGLSGRQTFGEFCRQFGKLIARINVLAIGLIAQLVPRGKTLGCLVKR